MDERDGVKAEEVAGKLLLATVGPNAVWEWEDVGDDENGPVYLVRLPTTTAKLRIGPSDDPMEWPKDEMVTLTAQGQDDNEVVVGTSETTHEIDILWDAVNWSLRGERVVNDLLSDLSGGL